MKKTCVIIYFVFACLISGGLARGADLPAGWSLVAAPTGVSVDVCAAWGAQGLDVQAFRNGAYVSCAQGPLMSRTGEAYWVYAPKTATLDTGAPAPVPATVALKRGWNLVGNPFAKALAWDGEILVDGGAARASAKIFPLLIRYNPQTGGYETTTAMEPGRGYIVLAREACSLTLPVPGEDPVVIAFEPLDPELLATDPATGMPYIAGQMVVQSAAGASGAQFEAALAAQGFTILGRNTYLGLYQVRAPAGLSDTAALAALAATPEAAAAVRHWVLSPGAYVPNDPPWQGGPAEQRWAFERVHAPEAWAMASATGPAIAVVDTGVDGAHPDLAGKVSGGADFITPGGDGATDPDGHGTHVAGIMAAVMDNAAGITGVCPHCTIVPVRVCDAGACPFFSVMNGVVYAANSGARIINLSIEGKGQPGSPEWQIFQNVIDYATARGAFVVAAAGNGGGSADAVVPAALNGVYAVGATDRTDTPASFSNNSLAVDLFAPGADVYSLEPGGGAGMRSGTSMAAAFVSGAAGLVVGLAPTVTNAEIQDVFREKSNPLGPMPSYNGGLLDMDRVLRQFSSGNQAPVIDALELSQDSIAPGGSLNATVRARDADDDFLEYQWTVTGGALSGGARDTKTWSGFPDRGAYRVTVTVTDGHGGSATANATLNVGLDGLAYIDIYPHVASVSRGDIVTFRALGTFNDGHTYPVRPLWSVDSGLGVMAPDGTFTALNTGVETVRARLRGLSGAMPVAIDTSLPPPALAPAAMTVVNQVPALATADASFIVMGDLDGDGDNDFIALSGIGTPNQVHINGGGGASFAATAFGVNSEAAMGALGDLDNDGDLDLVEAGIAGSPGIRIFANDGSGGFAGPLTLAAGIEVRSVAVRDMDNDGDPDIVAGLAGAQPVSVFWNVDGTGFDGTKTDLAFACNLKHAVIGDIDKDGWMDVVSACSTVEAQWWKNDQTGGFAAPAVMPGTNLTTFFAGLADVDGDDDLDYLALRQYTAGTNNEEIRVFKNDGAGTFTDSGATPFWVVGSGAKQFDLADHDNDGDIDIYAAPRSIATDGMVFLNTGAGAFPASGDTFAATVSSIFAGDLSGDKAPDVVIPDQTASLWRNNTANTAPPAATGLTHEFINASQVRLSWTWAPGADTTPAAGITFDLTMTYDDDYAAGGNPAVTVISGTAAERPGLIGHATRSANTFHYVLDTHGAVTGEANWKVRAVDAGFGRGAWSTAETIGCPVVSNLADTGMATLRDCINYANGVVGGATITFAPSIYGGTINVDSELPQITQDNTAIDGRYANITLQPTALCAGCNGLVFSAETRIMGLTIKGFDASGILVVGPFASTNALIGGNRTKDQGNTLINNDVGITLSAAQSITIQGNAIGTNYEKYGSATGTINLGNNIGILLDPGGALAAYNTIGDKVQGASSNPVFANTIAYNQTNGVQVNGGIFFGQSANQVNVLTVNSIYSNGAKAISLNGNGAHGNPIITPPEITSIQCTLTPNEYQVTIAANNSVAGALSGSYIYLYRADNDSSAPIVTEDAWAGEGYEFAGYAYVSGNATQTVTTTVTVDPAQGGFITAMRNHNGNTLSNPLGFSEFGRNYALPSCPCPGYVVTNSNDTGDGSLRACITAANSAAVAPTITFDSAYTIQPVTQLPVLGNAAVGITINGDSNSDGTPDVTINGALCAGGTGNCHGFDVSSNSNVIKNLIITGFRGSSCITNTPVQSHCAGVHFKDSANSNTIQNNYIGTSDGSTAAGNKTGVYFDYNADSNTVKNNVISGNGTGAGIGSTDNGILFYCGASICENNVITGNKIGVNAAGNAALQNIKSGIYLNYNAQNNIIGGQNASDRNIISGNGQHGISLDGVTVSGTRILGNYIGTDNTGLNGIGNTSNGINLNSSTSGNRIGGRIDTERNIISGNVNWGIWISGTTQTINNKIQGNFIGVDATGKAPMGNWYGIEIHGGSYNVIGSDMDGVNDDKEGNVIGGNAADGIEFNNINASYFLVMGNYIGVATDTSTAIPNSQSGISIVDGHHNRIGSATDTLYANHIVGNGGAGINVSGVNSDYNSFYRNTIYDNTGLGINLDGLGSNQLIAPPSIDNVTAAGTTYDVSVKITAPPKNCSILPCVVELFVADYTGIPSVAADVPAGEAYGFATSQVVTANCSAPDCTVLFSAVDFGTLFPDSTIITATVTDGDGNTSEFADNVPLPVSLCPLWKVTTTVDTTGTSGSLRECIKEANAAGGGQTIRFDAAIANQTISPNSTGSGALPAITKSGVIIDGETRNITLSGASCAGCDGFTFNTTGNNGGVKNLTIVRFDEGILIDGVSGTTVSGCKIGAAAPNANNKGISIINGASGSTIDGTVDRNIISGNTTAGIALTGSTGNTIKGNYIGVDATGNAALANGTGIILDASSNNTIGGAGASDRNVVSGNTTRGLLIDNNSNANTVIGSYFGIRATVATGLGGGAILIRDSSSNIVGTAAAPNAISGNAGAGLTIQKSAGTARNNVVQANYVGTNSTGANIPNGTGILVDAGASYNKIGGSLAASQGNIIGFNTAAGVHLSNGSNNNYVYGNYIGIDSTLAVDTGNLGPGITVDTAAANNFIGATDTDRFNYIAHNDGDGIALDTGNVFNALHRNIVFDSTLLGIAISSAGITPPAIQCSQPTGGNTYWIMGTSTCGAGCGVELFQADRTGVGADAPAGEAVAYLGTGTTDATGSFGVAITFPSAAGGTLITGTVSDSNGNTSAFANNYDFSTICDLCPGGVVTDTGDSGTTPGTLRACILKSNADAATSTISFTLGGPATITLGSTLPVIADDFTTITATGSITLDGGGSVPNMMVIQSSNNTITGLTLQNFSGRGIKIGTGGTGCSNNTIGGAGVNQGNTVIGAGSHGLEVDGGTCLNNTFSRNTVYESALAGINLALGANGGITPPTISCSTDNGGGSYTVQGTTSAIPAICNNCTVELFQTDNNGTVLPDGAFNGEALAYVGTASTDAMGKFTATIAFPHASAPGGKQLTATLTDTTGNTSMFGVNYEIIDNPTSCDICPLLQVKNVDDSGVSSLRACIEKANSDGAASVITVNLGAVATQTITLASPLPALTEAFPTTINGNGQSLVVNGGFFATDGLLINSANNVITDLSFVNFASSAIHLSGAGATGNTITKTRLGEDFAGAPGSNEIGILITSGASANTIGGTFANRNVIVNSSSHGIHIQDANSDDNIIQGNNIGVSLAGTAKKGNGGNGVDISGAARTIIGGDYTTNGNTIGGSAGPGIALDAAPDTVIKGNSIGVQNAGSINLGNAGPGVGVQNSDRVVIGGTVADERNIIGFNAGDGIVLDNSSNAAIHYNFIGTDNGVNNYQNAGNGIQLVNGSTQTAIGTPGFGNLIVFNAGAGVLVDGAAAAGNTILNNRIFNSGGLGIDLTNGANNSILKPAISDVLITPNPNEYIISVKVTSPPVDCSPATPCTVQVFAVDNPPAVVDDATGGEAYKFATSQQVTTSCTPSCVVTFNNQSIGAESSKITATITDDDGNTSEFSANYLLPTTSSCPVVSLTTDAVPNPPAGSLRDCIKRANTGGAALKNITFNNLGAPIQLVAPLNGSSAIYSSDISIIALDAQGITVQGSSIGLNCFEINPAGATVVSNIEIAGLSIHNCAIAISIDETNPAALTQNVIFRNNYLGVNRDGTVYSDTQIGLRIFHAQDVEIYDNIIARTRTAAIWAKFSDTSGINIHDNFIGTDASDRLGIGNEKNGIRIDENVQDVQITNNVISGNGTAATDAGILMNSSKLVSIENNRIGTNNAGTAAIPNRRGIFLGVGTNNIAIGGSAAAGEGNIVSGNANEGIYSESPVANITITGNRIGVDVNGTAMGNGSHGIYMAGNLTNSNNNTIGNQSADLANIIAHNGGDGIAITRGAFNLFSQNRIYNNAGKGITVPVVANQGLLPPVIVNIAPLAAPGAVQISGTAAYDGGLPCNTCRVEVFRVDQLPTVASDTSGAGEAYEYLGSITTDAAGAWASNSFAFATASGEWLTATVTNGTNNTSEFATNATVNYCPSVRSYYDSGANTLRSCITQANTLGGVFKDIDFDSAMAGKTIALDSALPGLTAGGITINNTSGGEITVDGQGGAFNCFAISSANNEIHDLSVVRCGAAAVFIDSAAATGNLLADNKIGTNNASAAGLGNGTGVMLDTDASGNTLNGNMIRNSTSTGVMISNGAHDNALTGNTIAGSANDGVVVKNNAHHNTVTGGTITGNGQSGMGHGVRLESGAADNTIGGSGAGLPNTITGNRSAGISADGGTTTGNKITENVIHSNDYLGIALDNGANGGIAQPAISKLTKIGASTFHVLGDGPLVNPCAGCVVELFRVDDTPTGVATDTSGAGEAYALLDTDVTDATGAYAFYNVTMTDGFWFTVTVTDGTDGTSEFSQNKEAVNDPPYFEPATLAFTTDNGIVPDGVDQFRFSIEAVDPNGLLDLTAGSAGAVMDLAPIFGASVPLTNTLAIGPNGGYIFDSASHTAVNAAGMATGTYTLFATVTDQWGATGATSIDILIENATPSVSNATCTKATVIPGEAVTISADVADFNGLSDIQSVTVDLQALTGAASESMAFTAGATYATAGYIIPAGAPFGNYKIVITALDKSGAWATASFDLAVGGAPTVVSVTFVPPAIPPDGVTTTTINVLVDDPDGAGDITRVYIVLDPIKTTPVTLDLVPFGPGSFLYTGTATVDSGFSAGSYTLTAWASDSSALFDSGDGVLSVTNLPPDITATSVAPYDVAPNVPVFNQVSFTTTVTDPNGQADVKAVTINLTPLGGPAEFWLFDDGLSGGDAAIDGVYTFLNYTVPAAAPFGTQTLTVSATDGNATDTEDIILRVNSPPTITNMEFVPSSTLADGVTPVTLRIDVADVDGFQDIQSVVADLTSLGLGSPVALTYSGPVGGSFRFAASVVPIAAYPNGIYPATGTVTDIFTRTATATANLKIVSMVPAAPAMVSVTSADNRATVTLRTPFLNTDGSPLTNLDHIRIWRRPLSGAYGALPQDTVATTATNTVIVYSDSAVTPFESYCYQASAVNTTTQESARSAEMCVLVYPPAWVYKQTCGDLAAGGFPTPSTPGFFNRPMDVAVDQLTGDIFVADTDNHRIQKFDKDCVFKGATGTFGSTPGKFKTPGGITLMNDKLYVIDRYDRVQVFDKNLVLIPAEQFTVLAPVTIEGAGGFLYITTTTRNTLVKYDTAGAEVASYPFTMPRAVDIDSAGNIYVTDVSENKIYVLDSGGTVQTSWGGPGTGLGQFDQPFGIAVGTAEDNTGALRTLVFVSDTQNNRIQIFDTSGNMDNIIFNGVGMNFGQLRYPMGLDLSPNGRLSPRISLIVTDRYNSRIQEFGPPGS